MRSHSLAATVHFLSTKALFRFTLVLVSAVLVAAQFMGSSSATRDHRSVRETSSPKAVGAKTEVRTDVAQWLNPAIGSRASLATLVPPAGPETIAIYKAGCTILENRFEAGDEVCVKDANYSARTRAIYWVNPDGAVVQQDSISSSSDTSIRTVNQIGTWRIYLVGFENEARDVQKFSVSDPDVSKFDLSVFKNSSSSFLANGLISYTVTVQNNGPDDATAVDLIDQIPTNTTFMSATQDPGTPTFDPCTAGPTTVTCSIATLPSGSTAKFTFFFEISGSATVNEIISNTVSIKDSTTGSATPGELHPEDNTWTAINPVTGVSAPGACSVGCAEDITKQADTTQGAQSGAIVHFSPPTGNGDCGPITVDHCNDCFFPVGTTIVTGSAPTGESCSFRVVISPASGSATISCPGDQTANATTTDCEASITIGTPTATGDNVTIAGTRSDGKPLYNCDCYPVNPSDPGVECEITGNCSRRADATFGAGVTTISWTAYSHDIAGPYPDPQTEEAHRTGSASCVQTITVNDTTAPVIGATDSTVAADATCQAAVPDYSNTVSDNCACSNSDTSEDCQGHPHFTVTQTPAAGTMVGLGPHTVHIVANDNSSNNGGAGNTTTRDVVLTVADQTGPVITCPANITTNTLPGTCAATVVPGTATATDNCDSTPTITGTRSDGRPLTDTYPQGPTTITWTATDDAGNHSSCNQTITVVDNEPPVIVFNGQTPSMWPPNHKYQTFQVTNFVSSVTDNCNSIGVSSVVITKVTSDEIENGNGDGNTMNDIVIAANCKSVQLRSEREGNGNGRVYTIFFKVVDSSGNVGTGTAKVVVQHNPGETAVDSGPHYTVLSSCP